MKRMLQWTLACYVIGILVSSLIALDTISAFLLLLFTLLAATVNEAVAWKKTRAYVFLAVFLLGMTMTLWQTEINRGNIDCLAGKSVVLRGIIVNEPDVRPNVVNYTVKVQQELSGMMKYPPKGLILLAVKGANGEFSYGDEVEIRGTPVIPEEPGNPGEFNYKKYLEQKGIRLIIRSGLGAGVHKIGPGSVNPAIDTAIKVKRKCISILDKSLSPQSAAIMEGMLFGSTGRIDPDIRTDFSLTGVVHILSVSGYHMALLVGAVVFLSQAAGLSRSASMLLTILLTAGYALMTGGNPPVLRALVMAWILLLAKVTGRSYDWSASLSAAALVLLIADPLVIYQPGFQLSFCATWGIFYLTPLIERFLPFKLWLSKALAGTIAAQLAVIPLMAYYFNFIPLISVFANLIIVPLLSLTMLLGSSAIMAGFFWLPLAEIINAGTNIIINLALWLTHLLAEVPFAGVIIKQPSVLAILVFYALIFLVKMLIDNREVLIRFRKIWILNRSAFVVASLTVITVLLWLSIILSNGRLLEITFLDIGQGDAVLIKSPTGKNVIIDTGGVQGSYTSFDPGEKILVPYLKRQGITCIDLLILTHPHADHIQGAAALAKYAKINLLVISPYFRAYQEGARMADLIGKSGTEIREVAGGEKLMLDENIYIDVISPLKEKMSDENNDSLVLKLSYLDFSVLFTGDAEQPVLEQILQNNPELRSDIVKVPHHGSRNAWVYSFYQNIKTSLAVISVGARNYFGHPSQEVLAGLSELKIPVLRTDLVGAVIVKSDGHTYKITTGKGME